MAFLRAEALAWVSTPSTNVCGTVARAGNAAFQTLLASARSVFPRSPLKQLVKEEKESEVSEAHDLAAAAASWLSTLSMHTKKLTCVATVALLNAQTVYFSQSQPVSSMQFPVVVRTAGFRVQVLSASLPKSLKISARPLSPNDLQPGQRDPKKYVRVLFGTVPENATPKRQRVKRNRIFVCQ